MQHNLSKHAVVHHIRGTFFFSLVMENTLILHRTPNQDPAALILPPVVKGGNSLVSTVRLINITSTEYILDKLDKTHETFTNSLLKLNKYS